MVRLIDVFYGNPYAVPDKFSFYIDAFDTLEKEKCINAAKKEIALNNTIMKALNHAIETGAITSPMRSFKEATSGESLLHNSLQQCSNYTAMTSGKGYNIHVERADSETNKQWQKRTQDIAQALNDNLDGIEKTNNTCKNGRIHLQVTPNSAASDTFKQRIRFEKMKSLLSPLSSYEPSFDMA
tara:strand:- start:251874 stop:252422 length:549 start_codon:yes stop_codon:yes gene_type:complete